MEENQDMNSLDEQDMKRETLTTRQGHPRRIIKISEQLGIVVQQHLKIIISSKNFSF